MQALPFFAGVMSVMNEIEQMWSELRTNTDTVYLDMLREMMSTINEKELIRKKKRVQSKRN